MLGLSTKEWIELINSRTSICAYEDSILNDLVHTFYGMKLRIMRDRIVLLCKEYEELDVYTFDRHNLFNVNTMLDDIIDYIDTYYKSRLQYCVLRKINTNQNEIEKMLRKLVGKNDNSSIVKYLTSNSDITIGTLTSQKRCINILKNRVKGIVLEKHKTKVYKYCDVSTTQGRASMIAHFINTMYGFNVKQNRKDDVNTILLPNEIEIIVSDDKVVLRKNGVDKTYYSYFLSGIHMLLKGIKIELEKHIKMDDIPKIRNDEKDKLINNQSIIFRMIGCILTGTSNNDDLPTYTYDALHNIVDSQERCIKLLGNSIDYEPGSDIVCKLNNEFNNLSTQLSKNE
jgi:hypothetical protein